MAVLVSPRARLSYPNLFVPRAAMGQTGDNARKTYGCSLIFDEAAQKTPEFAALRQAAKDVAINKWGNDTSKWPHFAHKTFRQGDDETHADKEGYGKGKIFINVTSLQPPAVVGRKKGADGKYITLQPNEVYAGMYVRAILTCFTYDNVSKGVSFGLGSIQKIEDGPSLGGAARPEEGFKPLEGDEEVAAATGGAQATGAADTAKARDVDALFG